LDDDNRWWVSEPAIIGNKNVRGIF